VGKLLADEENNIKMDLKNRELKCGLDLPGS
jgi:hypothetical protein